MNRNLSRISNYYNRAQALADWEYVAAKARAAGRPTLVEYHTPRPEYGWRRIDQCTASICAEFGWPLVYQMREADAQEAK